MEEVKGIKNPKTFFLKMFLLCTVSIFIVDYFLFSETLIKSVYMSLSIAITTTLVLYYPNRKQKK